ncbi:MAG: helix-turn-helix transcriptional regulator [Burkholderiales bacterium]|nr:helix-turn-helix transcriptional regulator [Opitutaceae bacterium]
MPADAAKWQPYLFPLHAATGSEALWRAVLPLLRAAFAPCARVTLFLGHFGMREARLVFTDPPVENLMDWYRERGAINPFTPYIRAHRRLSHYVFADVVGTEAEFRKTDFYRLFAKPEGWDKGMSGVFWERDEVKAMFSVYRGPGHVEFVAADVERLRYLRPHIETAIDRVRELHAERVQRKVLEEFSRHIPIGLMLLDWDLQPLFANTESVRECAVWQHGPEVARGLVSRDHLELPRAIREACEQLRAAILQANAKEKPVFPHALERVAHPTLAGRLASVSAINSSPGLLAKPGFLVVMEDRGAGEGGVAGGAARVPAEKQRLLWMLSPSEREIALLICEGCSNAEISTRLKKSLLTTKKQVTSIFAKLGVKSRARLMTLLR